MDKIDFDFVPDFDPSFRGVYVGSIADDAPVAYTIDHPSGDRFHAVYKVNVKTRTGDRIEVYGLMESGGAPYESWLPGRIIVHGAWTVDAPIAATVGAVRGLLVPA